MKEEVPATASQPRASQQPAGQRVSFGDNRRASAAKAALDAALAGTNAAPVRRTSGFAQQVSSARKASFAEQVAQHADGGSTGAGLSDAARAACREVSSTRRASFAEQMASQAADGVTVAGLGDAAPAAGSALHAARAASLAVAAEEGNSSAAAQPAPRKRSKRRPSFAEQVCADLNAPCTASDEKRPSVAEYSNFAQERRTSRGFSLGPSSKDMLPVIAARQELLLDLPDEEEGGGADGKGAGAVERRPSATQRPQRRRSLGGKEPVQVRRDSFLRRAQSDMHLLGGGEKSSASQASDAAGAVGQGVRRRSIAKVDLKALAVSHGAGGVGGALAELAQATDAVDGMAGQQLMAEDAARRGTARRKSVSMGVALGGAVAAGSRGRRSSVGSRRPSLPGRGVAATAAAAAAAVAAENDGGGVGAGGGGRRRASLKAAVPRMEQTAVDGAALPLTVAEAAKERAKRHVKMLGENQDLLVEVLENQDNGTALTGDLDQVAAKVYREKTAAEVQENLEHIMDHKDRRAGEVRRQLALKPMQMRWLRLVTFASRTQLLRARWAAVRGEQRARHSSAIAIQKVWRTQFDSKMTALVSEMKAGLSMGMMIKIKLQVRS